MNSNSSYSRYRNINSLIHSIDPISKFVCFLLITITLFLAQDPRALVIVTLTLLVIALIARVRIKSLFNILLIVLPFFILMWLIYAAVTWDAIYASELVGKMTVRLYTFILIAIIYTSTTKELDIARSIEWIISPLKYIKVPTYEISMMITLALRFIPILISDLFMILRAQTSRGINVVNGRFRDRVKGIFSSLLPMFVISFRRADDLAIAMTVRKYEVGQKRTKYWETKFGLLEIMSLLVTVSLMVVVILIRMGEIL